MKNYNVKVVIEFNQLLEAKNKKEAKEQVKSWFEQDYNITLENSEIKEVKEVIEL